MKIRTLGSQVTVILTTQLYNTLNSLILNRFISRDHFEMKTGITAKLETK